MRAWEKLKRVLNLPSIAEVDKYIRTVLEVWRRGAAQNLTRRQRLALRYDNFKTVLSLELDSGCLEGCHELYGADQSQPGFGIVCK